MTCNMLCPAEEPDSLPENRGTNRIFAVISALHVMESGPNRYQMAGHFLTADPNLEIERSFLIATVIVHLPPPPYYPTQIPRNRIGRFA
jgi:hypothetical protein